MICILCNKGQQVLICCYFVLIEQECCWTWDSQSMSGSITIGNQDEVLFHPDYSCGTAAIRGEEPFELGCQHYWEIKMTSAVYGTDMVR
jgi:hypothetical protein